jgi:hypothetical protein
MDMSTEAFRRSHVGRTAGLVFTCALLSIGAGASEAGARALGLAVSCPSTGQCTTAGLGDGFGAASKVLAATFDPGSGSENAAGPTQVGSGAVTALSCPSATQCTAVTVNSGGSSGEVTFDPATGIANAAGVKQIEPNVGASGDGVTSVSCPSSTQCTAVDPDGRETTFDPATGAVNPSVTVAPNSWAVSCPLVTQCTATADIPASGITHTPDSDGEVTFDPTTGTVLSGGVKSVTTTFSGHPFTISCPAASQCTETGRFGDEETFDPTTGMVNAAGTTPVSSGSGISSLSCPSMTQCTASDVVGQSYPGETTFNPTTGAINAAGRQTILQTPPDPNSGPATGNAAQLSCPSTTQCTAVAPNGSLAETFDPTTGAANAAGVKSLAVGAPAIVPPPKPRPPVVKPSPKPPTVKQILADLVKTLLPSGKSAKIAAILKSGGYVAKVTLPEAGTQTITWYYVPKGAKVARKKKAKPKPVVIATGSKKLTKAGKATLKVKLTKTGKAMLKKVKKGHKLKLTAKGAFKAKGSKKTTSKTKVFSLKR